MAVSGLRGFLLLRGALYMKWWKPWPRLQLIEWHSHSRGSYPPHHPAKDVALRDGRTWILEVDHTTRRGPCPGGLAAPHP